MNIYLPAWLKWTIGILCIILLSCFIYSVYLYYDIQKTKTASYPEVQQTVKHETNISSIDKIEQYHGEKAYYIVYGQTKKMQKKIAFYPSSDKGGNIKVIDRKKIIPETSIQKAWKSQCGTCELVEITPALIGEKAAWEVTFIDESDRYVFDYLSIFDGSRIEQIRLKQMFN
ncbi:cell wall elongation regulator TseB-like domain-containing protein [Virgibacillus siamensis]|uniref:cell wall elongation regulator TseB-like domain-containing protein n=1 Tax=Virgibacillus siamensis TaxID=480071 RepID=UPI000986E7A6|nr:DUF5590 domain-containing protein [Virgibacillus siamensis]